MSQSGQMTPLPGADKAATAQRSVLLTCLDGERFGFPLEDVVEVLPAMASTPLPHAPPAILGVVNLRGDPLPLIDLRVRLGGGLTTPDPEDHVVVCRILGRQVGVWVDRAVEVASVDAGELAPVSEVAQSSHVRGVALVSEGVYLVYDVQSFLDADEALRLDAALRDLENGGGR